MAEIFIRRFTPTNKLPAGESPEKGCLAVFSVMISTEIGTVTLPNFHLFQGARGFFVKPPSRASRKGFEPVYFPDNALRRSICTAVLVNARQITKG